MKKAIKKFLDEFKAFALKGNVLDLAVGVIIGGAFTGIVTSLTANFIQPILDFVTRAHKDFYSLREIMGVVSALLTAVLNFLIIALVLFFLVKAINKMLDHGKKKPEPTEKVCPYCKSKINIEATRCPFCTSVIETEEE